MNDRQSRARASGAAAITKAFARFRIPLLLFAAVGFGLVAALGARSYISERLAVEQERLNPVRQMAQVVVAKHDLPAGSMVDASTMAVRQMPAEFIPGGVIGPDSFEHAVGARLGRPMRSGEPLLPGALDHVRDASFSSRIRQGIRAMTIQVDEVNSVSGMLEPGDRIDLMFSVRPPAGSGVARTDEVTAPLIHDLPVLATGRQVLPGSDPGTTRPYTAITVEVSPDQAQRLIVAQRNGRLTATLRNPDDRAPVRAGMMDVSALLGTQKVAPPAPPVSRPIVRAPRSSGPEIYVGGTGKPIRSSASPAASGASGSMLGPSTARMLVAAGESDAGEAK